MDLSKHIMYMYEISTNKKRLVFINELIERIKPDNKSYVLYVKSNSWKH